MQEQTGSCMQLFFPRFVLDGLSISALIGQNDYFIWFHVTKTALFAEGKLLSVLSF